MVKRLGILLLAYSLIPSLTANIQKHATKPDIRVRIRRRIIQIDSERTGISSIVPIAAAKDRAR